MPGWPRSLGNFAHDAKRLWQFRDVGAGILQGDELTARQRDRVLELTFPATVVYDIALRHLYSQGLGFPNRKLMPSFTAILPSVAMDWK